jgi:hypothetical protein
MNPAQATELARAELQSAMGADQMPTVRMHARNSRQRRLREGCFTVHVVDMYTTLFLLGGGTQVKIRGLTETSPSAQRLNEAIPT